MNYKLKKFKDALEYEFNIAEWNPTDNEIYNIANEIKNRELSKGQIYQIIKINYSGEITEYIRKGMDFNRLNKLLEIALLAAEATEYDE